MNKIVQFLDNWSGKQANLPNDIEIYKSYEILSDDLTEDTDVELKWDVIILSKEENLPLKDNYCKIKTQLKFVYQVIKNVEKDVINNIIYDLKTKYTDFGTRIKITNN